MEAVGKAWNVVNTKLAIVLMWISGMCLIGSLSRRTTGSVPTTLWIYLVKMTWIPANTFSLPSDVLCVTVAEMSLWSVFSLIAYLKLLGLKAPLCGNYISCISVLLFFPFGACLRREKWCVSNKWLLNILKWCTNSIVFIFVVQEISAHVYNVFNGLICF